MALMSPHLPTPTFTFLDYDLTKKLGLELSNVQMTNLNQDTGTSNDEPDASFDGEVQSVAAQTLIKAS